MLEKKKIRKEIAACRQAGREQRFDDALQFSINAIEIISSSSSDEKDPRLLAVAQGYKGMSLLKLKEFEKSTIALEDSYRLFTQEVCSTSSTPPPILEKVIKCMVQVCHILNRSPPLPPLIKFPRTAHLFKPTNSKAVTDDDLVLQDDSFFKLLAATNDNVHVSFEEKIDGANIGFSLSLDGNILIQNRSHYISHGEHAQFSQLNSWVSQHEDAIKKILLDTSTRRILYGEWLVAKHSIPYKKLPGYFIAFDIYDVDEGFVSRKQFHNIMYGSHIPVTPTLTSYPDMTGMKPQEIQQILLDMLHTTRSQFRSDDGPIEGLLIRIDVGDRMTHRCKLVDPNFTAGITGHWAKSKIDKQRVDVEFGQKYLGRCYHHHCNAAVTNGDPMLPTEVTNPRQRSVVTYKQNDDGEGPTATCSVLSKEQRRDNEEGTSIVLPRNLCWLWPDEVAVSSTPKSKEQIRSMNDALKVGLVITLTKEQPLPQEWFFEGCSNSFHPVADGMSPTIQEIDDIGDSIVRAVAKGKVVLEHCGGGKGRAGTIAACLLLRFGKDGIRANINVDDNTLRPCLPYMSGEEAIAEIRKRRPGSLETGTQESCVHQYAQYLWRKAYIHIEDESAMQSVSTHTVSPCNKMNGKKLPKYIILAGLPGSGKSTLASQLCNQHGLVHISTDEMGKKGALAAAGFAACRVGQGGAAGVLIDACNINSGKRQEWLDIMFKPQRSTTCLVFFDIPKEVCISRVSCRVDHPTIPFGRGARIVETFAKQQELPTHHERDLFGQIIIIKSVDEVPALLTSWGL